jgi:hypothetical protein
MRDYYHHIVRDARRGDPTIDEARADHRRAIAAQLSALVVPV